MAARLTKLGQKQAMDILVFFKTLQFQGFLVTTGSPSLALMKEPQEVSAIQTAQRLTQGWTTGLRGVGGEK